VAGIVSGVVHRFDVRETGEIHQARTQDRRAKMAAVRRWLKVAVLVVVCRCC
jgi:hypothetical protein